MGKRDSRPEVEEDTSDRGDAREADSPAEPESVTGVAECAVCGRRFDAATWHPVTTRTDDGEFRLYAFCSTDCRGAWRGD